MSDKRPHINLRGWLTLLGAGLICGSMALSYAAGGRVPVQMETTAESPAQMGTAAAEDSTYVSRYPVAPTTPEDAKALEAAHPADLKQPENLKTVIEYDWKNNRYLIHTMLGEKEIGYPIPMTQQEYLGYTERQERNKFFYSQYQKAVEEEEGKGDFDLLDMQFSLGPAEKLFGPGGIRVKTQGSAGISMGMKHNVVDNPTLSEQARDQWTFDFNENVQLNMKASVGSKMSFDLNYNTEATFDFDATKFKLAFAGDEDDIVQNIEAGNVSMTTGNSLISGGASLFGVKSQLKFGKLNITALLAKQESTSKTVSSKGGVTKRSYELTATDYDENRHYFLGQFFRDTYDQNMSLLPLIASGIEITKIEVWMTNKRSNYDNARNILAFSDLGEATREEMQRPDYWKGMDGAAPANGVNSLYSNLCAYDELRQIELVTTGMEGFDPEMKSGRDFEKIESARMLQPSEYSLNSSLGYLSLKTKIDDDCVLAVAFQYTKGGQTYQVGEFASDNSENATRTLFVKLLKSTTGDPSYKVWDLMMKNIYSLGVTNLSQNSFTMQIQYLSDSVGVYTNYINEAPINKKLLIQVMNLDQINQQQERHSDGQFDWLPGYTVQAQNGRIIFPVVEPFGSHLAKMLGNDPQLVERYCYPELYRMTLTEAEQVAEHNKFRIKGEYSASNGAEISLGAMNVARGSVRVTAGGTTLTEGSDYSVDYTMGIVTILNQSIIDSGTNVSVSLEDQSEFSLQRKTMMGLDMQYDWSKDLKFGATVINLSERPLTKKVSMTEIPINNTIYGFNLKWNRDFMWLTNAIGYVPWIKATAPSNFSLQAEYAQLVAGHSSDIGQNGSIYIDDFEQSESSRNLAVASMWQLSSTPVSIDGRPVGGNLLTRDYNAQRAHLAWYRIDHLFTSQTSNMTPSHIKNDLAQLSDPRVRQVTFDEIYPNKELEYGETGILDVLNLAYYPQERGQYNVSADRIDREGHLKNPADNWGGMMRAMEVTNFESANYEYIEFWMMDPFDEIEGDPTWQPNDEGKLVIHLGEVSEDILKDGYKGFENGLDINGDLSAIKETLWGRVSTRSSTVYAFDNSSSSHATQDVGLNGLSTADEFNFPTYKNYVDTLRQIVDGEVLDRWERDPFSPLNDPAGDNYHYFRGSDWDRETTSILNRYKYINGTEGNAPSTADSKESYSTAYKSTPDVEDINTDNTLNEYERYYEYVVDLQRGHMNPGENKYLADVSTRLKRTRDGQQREVTWYLFRIPLRSPDRKEGNISNFKSIRFMRMLMTGWQEEQVLRLATLDLVRSDWRTYTGDLSERGYAPSSDAMMSASSVNIEEHSGSLPVNYVLPPGITRIVTPGNNSVQQNEQALALKVSKLSPHDAVAVYKNSGLDLRQYENLQLFAHAHANQGEEMRVSDGDLAVFLRVGSDYKDNYYEYEVPLHLTPAGRYSNDSPGDRLKVWPEDNMINVSMKKLTSLKRERNRLKELGQEGVAYTLPYTEYDPDNKSNRMTIVGNPSLSDCSVIMIGVRNVGRADHSATIWVNELRTDGMDESGGWAARGNATLRISDLATINGAGSFRSIGWGSVEQSTANRSLTEDYEYNVSGQTDLGKWVPQQLKLTAPFYYSYAKSVNTPKYDPYNEDLTVDETLSTYPTEHQKDSIRALVQTVSESSSMSISGMKFDVKSKASKPWDPANVTMSYSQNRQTSHNPTTEYEYNNSYKGSINYNWSPFFKPWKPFAPKKDDKAAAGKNATQDRRTSRAGTGKRDPSNSSNSSNASNSSNSKSPFKKLKDDFQLNWLPNSISLSANVNRTYFEEQLRNIEAVETDFTMPVSYTKTFTMMRQTSINWDVTKTLKLNFQSATNSRVDEPDVPVNRYLYPDEYERWRDTIWTQLWKLGTPVTYNQQFDASWNIPINKISWTDWLTSSVKYKSTYQWNRGTQIDENTSTGNNLQNNSQWQFDGKFNLETLYNKSRFLKKVNDKFKTTPASGRGNNAAASRKNGPNSRISNHLTEKRPKELKQEFTLVGGDTTITFKHNMDTRRIIVSAHDMDNDRSYPLEYKRVGRNAITFTTADSVKLQVTVKSDKPLDDMAWYKTLQVGSRLLMSVRSMQFGYKQTQDTYLPYFLADVGDFYGQGNGSDGLAPGLGFAFGFESGESFTRKAQERGWLIMSESLTTPAVYSTTQDLNYQAVLEPWTGLKINLTGTWKRNDKESHQFMSPDLPISRSGSFQMTTIAMGSAFGGHDPGNGYSSQVFDQFIANRDIIYGRLLAQYTDARYPTGGFMRTMEGGDQYAGMPFIPGLGSSRINTSDVLVPAFTAAYLGGDAHTVSLDPIPSMWKALPNWKVTYDGLLQLFPKLATWFKSLQLSHTYNCTYAIGNYQTYTNYVENEQGLGYVLDVTNNCPMPSSEFDIGTVTLTESFAPLLGLNATLLNGLSLKGEYRSTRSVSLAMSSAQITENVSKDLTIGVGYKLANFNTILGMPDGGQKGVNHDLNMKLDITHKDQMALLRKINDAYTQATSGNQAWTIKFTADYQFSKMLQMKLYYNRQSNTPLVSTSYPTVNSDFGMTLSLSLTR